MSKYLPLLFALGLAACGGGGGGDNAPLISGSVTGTFASDSFTVKNGVLGKTTHGSDVIILGTETMTCASPKANDPPGGHFASIAVPALAIGLYGNVLVNVYENEGDFSGSGSNSGSLEILTLDDISLGATITYSDTVNGRALGLSGTFEIERCPN